MQWSAVLSHTFGGDWSKALQLLSVGLGLTGVLYGLQVLMVERAEIPVCSAEILTAVGEQSFLRQQNLMVEVAGAVVNPGVWQVAVGSRMADAIEKAGGLSQRADRTFAVQHLNLASSLTDGEKIYVPFEGEISTKQANQASAEPTAGQAGEGAILGAVTSIISINQASAKELESLPGIGEARAAKIIENRPYTALNDLVSKGALTEGVFTNLTGLIGL
jgi:DNA uptake protein ComE-like DNA-binding protein